MSNESADAVKSEARWDAAAQLAADVPHEGVRTRRRDVLAVLVVLCVGVLVLAIVADAIFDSDAGSAGDSGIFAVRIVAQVSLLAVGFIIFIAGLIWGLRTGQFVGRKSVVGPLNAEETTSVRRQIAGKERVDPVRLPVVLASARQNRRATWGTAPLFVAVVFFVASSSSGTNGALNRVLELAMVLLFTFATALAINGYRRAGRFIETNGQIV